MKEQNLGEELQVPTRKMPVMCPERERKCNVVRAEGEKVEVGEHFQ